MGEAASELLTIGELAERVGVATSALRYYEEVGLLEPTERRAGRRHYHPSAAEIDLARQALEHGSNCPASDIISCPSFTALVHQRVTTRVPWTEPQPKASRTAERRR